MFKNAKFNQTYLIALFSALILGGFVVSVSPVVRLAVTTTAPTLIYPPDGAQLTTSTPKFQWQSTKRASFYILNVSLNNDPGFNNPVIATSVSTNSFIPTSPLADGSYIWRVRAFVRKIGYTNWSSVYSFAISTPGTILFQDDFSSFAAGSCLSEGTIFGNWTVKYSGFGCVKIESASGNNYLHENPLASTSPPETHASLVLGPSFNQPFAIAAKVFTAEQLRTGSNPNAWEVAWLLWNYADDQHFYYFIVKPNGWELGKADPAYPGGQRFLATGSSPTFPIGRWYVLRIEQRSNNIKAYVNSQLITEFTDQEGPYASGKIGLYSEDAHSHFDDISVEGF